MPIVGLVLAGVEQLTYRDVSGEQLGLIMVALGGTALVSGFLVTVGSARAVADPIRSVRREMRRVEEGDLGAHVAVYDGAELGRLQAGFNRMVVGLRERERLRDLFGRQVGRDVAQVAVAADEVRLGGELRRVAVLFVDLVGSTALAARCPPAEVVTLLNRFFSVVVDVVEEHGGWINKFEGDAALAVFGAPAEHPDAGGWGARGRAGAGPAPAGGGAGGGRRDRRVGGGRGGGQRRLDAPLRIHGHRRSGERGGAAHRVLEAAARAAVRVGAGDRARGGDRGDALGARRGGAAARSVVPDADRGASGLAAM